MKILFIHNSLPEYRIRFMSILSEKLEIDFLITDYYSGAILYNYETQNDAKFSIIDTYYNNAIEIIKKIIYLLKNNDYQCIVLPPVDNIWQYIYGAVAIIYSRKSSCLYWAEKWEPDKQSQPYTKRIKNKIQSLMIKSLAMKCDVCVAAGKKSAEYLSRIGCKKIKIAFDSSTSPINSKPKSIRNKYGIPNTAKVILYFGRLVHRKGCHNLISAYKNLIIDYENIYLIVCGMGEEDYVNQLKRLAGSDDHIFFTGQILPLDRRDYFSASNVFVLPSLIENGVIEAWGLTVNESFECGVPVIATTAVGAAYDLIDGENGIIVKENDIENLEGAIKKVLFDYNEEYTKKKCLLTYRNYSVEMMAQEFLESIFESVSRKF